MATDFEAEGLLDGLDGDARDARRHLLTDLETSGVPLEELRAACDEGRLAVLPLERALAPPGERFTFEQMAEHAALDEEFLAELVRALGLPMPDGGEAIFTKADLDAARTVANFRAAGLDDDSLLEVTRVLGHSLSQIVAALRSMFTQSFFSDTDSEYDVAVRWAAAAEQMNPILEEVVGYLLRAHQVAQLRQGVFDLAGLQKGSTKVSVAFADLAGFTRLGEQVAADQLGSVAGRGERALQGEQRQPSLVARRPKLLQRHSARLEVRQEMPARVARVAVEPVEQALGLEVGCHARRTVRTNRRGGSPEPRARLRRRRRRRPAAR